MNSVTQRNGVLMTNMIAAPDPETLASSNDSSVVLAQKDTV